jgi:uncharacterized repeat protein (TIGR03803 family)
MKTRREPRMSAKNDSGRAQTRSGSSAVFMTAFAVVVTLLGSVIVAHAQQASNSPVTVLHNFGISESHPSSLIKGSDGRFYGTWLSEEVTFDCGGLYRMDPDGRLAWLHVFHSHVDRNGFLQCPGGDIPWALTEGADRNLYGVTYDGGKNEVGGIIYRLTKDGVFTLLHNFGGAPFDGANPQDGLILGSDGNFYGTTRAGGNNNVGTVFRMTPEGTVTILHNFGLNQVPTGGARPPAKLIEARDGLFYGVTGFNPDSIGDYGTVFRISKDGNFQVIHRFRAESPAGYAPVGPLMQASDGDFYGTTQSGGRGQYAAGTVFRMTPHGSVTYLHSFRCGPTGGCDAFPGNALVEREKGFFYSTVTQSAFRISRSGKFTTLHTFTPDEGMQPNGLVLGDDGFFYGDAQGGGVLAPGVRAYGTAFSFKVDGPD